MITWTLTLRCDLCTYLNRYEGPNYTPLIANAFLDGWSGPGISIPPDSHLRCPVCLLAEQNTARLSNPNRR